MRARGGARDDVSGARTVHSRFFPWAATLAATLAIVVITAVHHWRDNALITTVGQQQVRVLRDGTRVVLNTDTRIEVNYDARARRVRLVRGEARFDVSKHPTWPFLVTVGDREIRALGTSSSCATATERISRSPWSRDGSVSRPSRGMTSHRRKPRKSWLRANGWSFLNIMPLQWIGRN